MPFEQVCVLGLGYIGLPTACTFATHGVRVLAVDVDARVVETLRNGGIHIHEPGLRDLVEAANASGNLRIASAPEPSQAYIIAVPTPFQHEPRALPDGGHHKLADLGAVRSAAEAIIPVLRRDALVVLESTSPVGTTRNVLVPILERSGLKAGADFHVCYSPERVLPGQILRELVENARIIGGLTPEAARRGRELYQTFVKGDILETDAATAEMVKLMENTYRDVNIAIANEFSRLARRSSVDIWEAISLANRHPRVRILNPGPGVGGHCISVDPWFLAEPAPDLAPLILTSRGVNDAQPAFVISSLEGIAGPLQGRHIAVLGLAYKPDVDDLRESPAIEVVRRLRELGAQVTVWEPFAAASALNGIENAASLAAAVSVADLILLLVRHSQFLEITPSALAGQTQARLVFDTVNAWRGPEWTRLGFKVHFLGDGKTRLATA